MISTKTKNRWDYYNVIDGAKLQGEARGKAEGAHETAVKVAANLKVMGFHERLLEAINSCILAGISSIK